MQTQAKGPLVDQNGNAAPRQSGGNVKGVLKKGRVKLISDGLRVM
jgi:hypothetical protein